MMRRLEMLAAGLLLATPPAALAQDGDEILRAVDRALAPESFEAYRRLINIEPDGSQREFTLYTLKKGADNVVSLFLAPASERGRATLRLGDNMWLYIPNVGKPVRITSLQSVVGGVFNNADIMRLEYHVEYAVESVESDQRTHVLELKARSRSVAYDQLRMTVDREAMVPLEVACRAASGLLIKTLHFKQMRTFDGGVRRPAVVETDSPLQVGYKSVMVFGRIRAREIPDEVFTLSYLPRIDSLR
jgi:hypothetical protein